MVGCPRVIRSRTFETDPAVLGRVADCFGSCLVVACVVRTLWLGMKSVVQGCAVWASARIGGQIATG